MPPVSPRSERPARDDLVAHLRALASTRGRATLTLVGGPFKAIIVVDDGRVRDAKVDGAVGERALSRALDASSGTWRKSDDVPSGRSRTADIGAVDALVKKRDDVRALATSVGGLDQVWTVRFRVLSRELPKIPDEVNPLLRLLDGSRSVARVLAEAPFDELLTLRILHRLLAKGVLVVPDEPGEAPRERGRGDAMAAALAAEPWTSPSDSLVPRPAVRSTPPMPRVDDVLSTPPRDDVHVDPTPTRAVDDDVTAPPHPSETAPPAPVAADGAPVDDAQGPVDDAQGDDARAERQTLRPLPSTHDDELAPAPSDSIATPVALTSWSMKRERPPATVPPALDDDEAPRVDGAMPPDTAPASAPSLDAPSSPSSPTHEAAPAAHAAHAGGEGTDDPADDSLDAHDDRERGELIVVVEPTEPSRALADWLDEEHAFFARDAAAAEPSLPPLDASSERRTLVAVVVVLALLLTFAVLRIVTSDDEAPDDAPASTTR